MVHTTEDRARKAGATIKRSTLSLVGFITWFQTLVHLEDTVLHEEDQAYIRSLRLGERAKTGVLYNISRDLHEANFPHLVKHRVPIHVAWTEEEKSNWRFLRLNPEVWSEYAAVRASKSPGETVSLVDLPSGATWLEEWKRSDWFFQNKYASKRGDIVTEFLPSWDYAIIDFHLWGARPLLNAKRIRAYAERFKAAITTTDRGTTCTFFRQNPLGIDEPPFDRVRPEPHFHMLESFSLLTDNEVLDEDDVFCEPTEVMREQHKNIHAPRPSRPFNSFNGARKIVPLDKSLRGNTGNPSKGRRQRGRKEAGGSSSRTCPSAIPDIVRQDSGEHPFSGPSPVHSWEPGFQTEEQARDAIEAWAPAIVELIPVYGSYPGLVWNQEWLANAVLVCDDKRTYWRLKAYAAIFKGFTKFEELLEVAIRMALPFALFIKRSDVRKFCSQEITALDLNTLGALYTPGYVDQPLVWTGAGGGPAVYGQYEGRVGSLLGRPEAVAFVPLGGVCCFIAEVYDENIVYRYARGPSLQVSEFDEGEARRIERLEGDVFYTSDRVSNSEIFLLLGHIAGSSSSADRTLWPTPEVFECESPHMRGYLSEGAYSILTNLRRDILDKKRYKWCTYSQWKEYFHVGSKRIHEPKAIPKKKDFEEGAELINRAFPINWLEMDIGDIVLPEEFEPHAQRD
ncbi:hypothetical protein B0H13DRAFT_1675580 [Mycena leptocephala]|nr:hypothetical protein B0H13DRAFT_1675580 [Mycena leptocephala]